MTRRYPLPPPDELISVTSRHYQWFIAFWHIFYLGLLAMYLGIAVSLAIYSGLSWQMAALVIAILAQAGLYTRLIIFNRRWPIPLRTLGLYFGGSLVLWFIEWRIEPGFFWLIMSYGGQMYGLAPPVFSIPGSALIFLLIAAQSVNGSSAEEAGWQIFGLFMGWLSFTGLFLFIHYLGDSNQKRAKLILELQAAQKELEASRQREAELAVLRERERLARDLHDSLGYALVALSVQLEAVQRLYKVDPEQASTQIEALKALTRSSMDSLRRSLDGLRAPGLGDRPLRQALQTLSEELSQRAGVKVDCRLSERADQLNPTVAETVWRVTQEALTNVERHAHAHQVQVTLDVVGGDVVLRVADDGVGLSPEAQTRPGHYGLRGIRERVEGLGGELRLHNSGGATVVEARLPSPVRQ